MSNNKKVISDIIAICKMNQSVLLDYVTSELKKNYQKVNKTKKYVYARGKLPVLLVAHLDTVHHITPVTIWTNQDNTKIKASEGIGGDDRCGVYIILQLIKQGFKPSILFTTDEEIGGLGAEAFTQDYKNVNLKVNCMVEFDRKGTNDVVCYDDDNDALTKVFESFGFISDYGSFSDISILAPAFKISAVNLSSGYVNAHSKDEEIHITPLLDVIKKASLFLSSEHVNKRYTYVESPYTSSVLYGNYNNYRNYNDDYYFYKNKPIEKSGKNHFTKQVTNLFRNNPRTTKRCYICEVDSSIIKYHKTVDGDICQDCLDNFMSEYVKCPHCGIYTYNYLDACESCRALLPKDDTK